MDELCIGRHLCCLLRHVLVQVRHQVHAKAAQRRRHAAQQGGMFGLDVMLPPQDNLRQAAQRRKAVAGSHPAVCEQLRQGRQRSTAQLHTLDCPENAQHRHPRQVQRWPCQADGHNHVENQHRQPGQRQVELCHVDIEKGKLLQRCQRLRLPRTAAAIHTRCRVCQLHSIELDECEPFQLRRQVSQQP